ncbi:MAG: SCP2 sterol-binding domain-containing protein [Anaerolineales bacterium]|nr:SCP2 sterol-binding domain-containing protein [Anaerolineales bacterium]
MLAMLRPLRDLLFMEKVTSIQEAFAAMPARFSPEKAGDLQAVFQFDLTGEGGGQYVVTITNGTCTVSEGVAPNPTTTITVSAADYLAIVNGELQAMPAFMQGRLKIRGDLSAALKMQQIFALS